MTSFSRPLASSHIAALVLRITLILMNTDVLIKANQGSLHVTVRLKDEKNRHHCVRSQIIYAHVKDEEQK